MTTIAISKEVRDKIKEFGNKGESYSEIVEKLYQSACERQIEEILMDTSDCVDIEEAIRLIKEE
jgi:predicted CopG family antitoxin